MHTCRRTHPETHAATCTLLYEHLHTHSKACPSVCDNVNIYRINDFIGILSKENDFFSAHYCRIKTNADF